MLDHEPTTGSTESSNNDSAAEAGTPTHDAGTTARRTTRRRSVASTDTGDPAVTAADAAVDDGESKPAKKTTRSRVKKSATPVDGIDSPTDESTDDKPRTTRRRKKTDIVGESPQIADIETESSDDASTRTRGRKSAAIIPFPPPEAPGTVDETPVEPTSRRRRAPAAAIFVAPVVEPGATPVKVVAAKAVPILDEDGDEDEPVAPTRTRRRRASVEPEVPVEPTDTDAEGDDGDDDDDEDYPGESAAARRRRRRGRRGRGRGKGPLDEDGDEEPEAAEAGDDTAEDDDEVGDGLTRRRRRRRRRGSGTGEDAETEDGVVTVVKIREPRPARDEVQGVTGSTRLEAKRQRRRDGRDQRRTRPAILSESEFLARREAVDRVMAIRQKGDRTQIAVMEDGVLVEHYVTRVTSGSMVGNVYLGKVQNVLPSMEAAFVDIGRGRNAVLYAGEVNWDMAGLEGRARSIEQALKSGDSVLVQVTKDPVGHKGARLTSHVALSGRHLVYVPNGNASGISRKLSDVERKRLRDILKRLVPEGAGVIVRTAAEGASEEELERDVTRLRAQWSDIEAKSGGSGAPVQLYEEPDLVIRVVRDLFNEDFRELIVQGSESYDMVESYLGHVSPDLVARLRRHAGAADIFATYRIDEQILKGLDRKVFLPSGGSLVIDRTEAMTVIDVNTGKYTGTGGNLEETVTRNNLEAAEEIVRQLRLRDLGGIIVIDFIDMVLESNRELVLRRLTECLGRDRTKHQVTEITSLGLVQMTRKRIGQGLLEAFSETCEHCKGRGLILHLEPVPEKRPAVEGRAVERLVEVADVVEPPNGRRRARRGRGAGTGTAVLDAIDEDVEDDVDDVAVDEPDELEPVVLVPPPVRASVWEPPTSSWVNLGAASRVPVNDPETPAEPEPEPAVSAEPEAELELESESESAAGAGRRRRGSRWRLRP